MIAKRGVRRASSAIRYAYDIEQWTPDRLTHRNWFLVLVVLINIPSVAYQIYQVVPVLGQASGRWLWMLIALLAVAALKIVTLIGVWFLSKLAAKAYLGVLAVQVAVLAMMPSLSVPILVLSIVMIAFHAGMFLLAIRSVWKPAFMPQHIKDRFGLS